MTRRKMKNGIIHISYSKIDFNCPHWGNHYRDDEDKYLDRCNGNKNGCTTIKCNRCDQKFGMTYNIMGDAVSFEI